MLIKITLIITMKMLQWSQQCVKAIF